MNKIVFISLFIILLHVMPNISEGKCVPLPPFSCPEKCVCVDNDNTGVYKTVICSGRNLLSVPSILPDGLSYLDLSRNNISEIRSESFYNCTSLLTLDLSFNKIYSLTESMSSLSSSSDNELAFDHLEVIDKKSSEHQDGNSLEKNKNYPGLRSSKKSSYFHDKKNRSNKPASVMERGSFYGLTSLQVLLLHHNRLKILNNGTFSSLVKMKFLDLSFNELRHLEDGAFRKLFSLEKLHFQHNALSPSSITLSDFIFEDLRNLRELNLQNNFPTFSLLSSNGCYPDIALSKLVNLQRLFIDGYFSSSSCILGIGFRNLTRLAVLELQIPGAYCNIHHIPRLFFSNISTTENLHLGLQSCNLKSIDSEAFSYLPTLVSLNLLKNEGFEFEGFEVGSMSLNKTSIKYLEISYIHRISLITLEWHYLRFLQNTSLEILSMRHNSIIKICPRVLLILPVTLKEWDLSINRIIQLGGIFNLVFLQSLLTLNVSVQNHYTVSTKGIPINTNSQYLTGRLRYDNIQNKITGNNVTELQFIHDSSVDFGNDQESSTRVLKRTPVIQSAFPKLAQISSDEWIDHISKFCPNYARSISVKRNGNFTTWMHPNVTSKQNRFNPENNKIWNNLLRRSFIAPLPKHLLQAYASDMKLGYNVPEIKFINNDVLEVLDLSKNFLRCFEGPLLGISSLKYLDLSYNYCQAVSQYFFKDLYNLKEVLLSQNSLGISLAHDMSGVTFSYLSQLEKIDLSYNNLRELSPFVFQMNTNLEIIRLSHNSLYQVVPKLAQLPYLRYLDLSFNDLSLLSQENMDDLDLITTTSNITISLLHNPLLCDCSAVNFILWYTKTHVTFQNPEKYTCKYINGSKILLQSIFQLQHKLHRQCNSPRLLTLVFFFSSSIMVVYLVIGFMYYHKHILYFNLYLRKLQFFRHFWQPDQRQMRDVFLVLDYQDIEWRRHVLDVLIPNLSRHGISYHVTEEGIDEPNAGRPIREVVEESVLRARKTLVLLTEDVFLEEENVMAVNMAKILQTKTHCQVLMFLGAQKLKVKDLPPRLYDFLKTCHIIKYSPQDHRFWTQLAREIKTYRILNKDFPVKVIDYNVSCSDGNGI